MNKTKCMGASGEQVAVVQRAEAQHECVIVQWDDGTHTIVMLMGRCCGPCVTLQVGGASQ